MNQLYLSLLAAIFISGAAAYLGTLMLQRRMSLVAEPLAHLAFPGVALALLYGFDVSLGAFPFVIVGIIIIWLLENKTTIPTDSLTAVVFATGIAISFLFLPIEEAESALVGDVTSVGILGVLMAIIFSLLVIFILRSSYKKMTIINVSEDLAKVEGINVKKYNLIYLFTIAIIVSLGVKLVGALLTAALVSIPAATSRNISWSMKSYSLLSVFFGILASVLGIILYEITSLPAGILIILFGGLFFLISVFWKNKKLI